MNIRGLGTHTVFLNGAGDTVSSVYRRFPVSHVLKVNDQGVSAAFTYNAGSGRIKGFTMDSNGVMIDSFDHYFGDRNLRYSSYLLDSYTDSTGNLVIHSSATVGSGFTYNIVHQYYPEPVRATG